MNIQLHHLKRCAVIVSCFVWLTTFTAIAQTERYDRPELTVRIAPAKPYLQEEITQTVRLVSAHPFEKLNLDLPDVDDTQIITVVQPKVRPFNSYGVEGFVYETTRVLYPEASGEYVFPAVTVSGVILDGEEEVAFTRRSDDVVLPVAGIPDSFEGEQWLVAKLIEMRQEYSVPLSEIRAGDTITRTATITANGLTGEHLPELTLRPSRGIKIVSNEAERTTKKTPGGMIGTLTQSFSIFVQEAAPTDFGPIRLIWWDSEADAGRRSALPAVRIEPLARDTQAIKLSLMQEATGTYRRSQFALASTVAVLLLGLGILGWMNTGARRLRPYDRQLLRQGRLLQDPRQQVQAILAWASDNFGKGRSTGIDSIKQYIDDPDIIRQLDQLNANAYSKRHTGDSGQTGSFRSLTRELIKRVRGIRVRDAKRVRRISEVLFGQPRHLPVIVPRMNSLEAQSFPEPRGTTPRQTGACEPRGS